MPTSDLPVEDYDPELSHFLDKVVGLSAERHVRGPDAFLEALGQLAEEFRRLRKYRTDRSLIPRLEAFAEKRFELVDDATEYAGASDEVLVLSMVLEDAAPLSVPALKRAAIRLSSVLTENGAPKLFGLVLKRLRYLAQRHQDAELQAWVQGVVDSLPGDDVAPLE